MTRSFASERESAARGPQKGSCHRLFAGFVPAMSGGRVVMQVFDRAIGARINSAELIAYSAL